MISPKHFRKDFPLVPLSSVVEFLDHMRKPITASERSIGDIPYYGANGLQDYVKDFIFDEELVLLAEDGGYFDNPDRGVAYKVSGKSWVNNHAHVLRPKQTINVDYLFRVLQNLDLSNYINGTTRAKLTKGNAARITIPLPPLAEQRRIAEQLDTADRILRLREKAIAKLEALIRSYFDDIALDNSNRKQLIELGRVVELKYGKSLPSQNRQDGKFDVYGSNGVVGSHMESITSGATIIVGRKGSFGAVNFSQRSCFPIDTTYYIDETATQQNIVWLRYALETLKLDTLNKSAAVPGLNREDAYRQKLQLIDRRLQNDFEMYTRKVWGLIEIQSNFIDTHKKLIASLLHKSFSVN
jgi:type I restriction enzyme S subunit